ncbi:GH25 family lysozyme, partial [Limosilactobacillus fermentum]
MTIKVVDVYSGSPRSYATDPNAQGVIVKATQSTGYVNPYCDTDYQAAKNAGKLLGVYHYAAGGDPIEEAKFFIANAKNYI